MNLNDFKYTKNSEGIVITGLNCYKKDLIIPEGVVKIAKDAFTETNIKSVVFPSSLKVVGSGAFYYCEYLQSVTFQADSNLEIIDEYAFGCCFELKKIAIPKSVKIIRLGAFDGCEMLEKVSLYQDVEIIKAEAFRCCDSLKRITVFGDQIPLTWQKEWKEESVQIDFIAQKGGCDKNVEEATEQTDDSGEEKSASKNTPYKSCVQEKNLETCRLDEFVLQPVNNGFKIVKPKDKGIKRLILPKEVVEIEARAFCECYGLTEFIAHKNLSYIGREAFLECSALQVISIDSSTVVASGAFKGCIALKSAHVTKKMLNQAVFANSGLQEVSFDSDVDLIPDYYFYNCPLKSVTLPDGIDSIMSCAFASCSQLKSITLPSELLNIWGKAFYKCASLESIAIPKKVSYIMEGTFCGCSSLKQVDLGKVSEIRTNAFTFCVSLEKLTIPKSVNLVKKDAFSGFLKQVKIVGKTPKSQYSKTPVGWDDDWISGLTANTKITFVK